MKNTQTNTSHWEESFLKCMLAGFDLLAAVVNMIVAIVALLNGKNMTELFLVFFRYCFSCRSGCTFS